MSDEQQQVEKKTRTLIVRGFKQIGSFERNNVTNYIYEVTAVSPEGEMVGVPLRSFKDMTEYLDKPIEYEIKPHDSEKYGRTYTMLPPKKKLTEQVDELRSMLVTMQEQVQALQARVFGAEEPAQASINREPPPLLGVSGDTRVDPQSARAVQQPTSTEHRSDDDIPF